MTPGLTSATVEMLEFARIHRREPGRKQQNMKRNVAVFKRGTYISASDGKKRYWAHDVELCDVLGQAKTVLVQVFGNRVTSVSNTRATVEVWHTALPSGRPSEVGKQLGNALTFSDLRPALQTVNGPMAGRVELLLAIDDTAQAAQQEYDLELHVTLIVEE